MRFHPGGGMTDEAPQSKGTPATHARPGFWADSRGAYSVGALAAAVSVSLVVMAVMWPRSETFEAGYLRAGLLLGAVTVLLFVPAASWIAWSVAAEDMPVLRRWFRLTAVATLVSVVPLALLLSAIKDTEAWPWLAVPMAGTHALWTAIFLLGRRHDPDISRSWS